MAQVAAILLAAGFSRRFGTQKLVHAVELNGCFKPLIMHSLLSWLGVFERVTLVINAESSDLKALVNSELTTQQAAKINWQICESALEGMAASLVCGVKANAEASGWLIGLADMPKVSASMISQVRDAITVDIDSSKKLVVPYYKAVRGHPVGFSAMYFDELIHLKGDVGARNLMQRDEALITRITSPDDGVLFDIDSPEDTEKLNN